jgi:hypothetical protein
MIITWILHLLLASSIAAFRLPDGLANGLYRAYHDDNGEEVIEYHGERNTTSPDSLEKRHHDMLPPASDSNGLERRDFRKIWESKCGCGVNLNHGDTDAAVQGLKDTYAYKTIDLGQWDAVFYWYGSVVAFVCYGPSWTKKQDITDACSYITKECGWYVAGTGTYDWTGMVNGQYNDAMTPGYVGYMANRADQICENAWASPIERCPGAPFTSWTCDLCV